MKIAPQTLYDVIDGTWPAASYRRLGPWTLREAQGGGQRVSAATTDGPVTENEISQAGAAMRQMGQHPLIMVRDGQDEMDDLLADLGWEVVDPVVAHACPVEQLTNIPVPRITVLCAWPPLVIMREIWAQGGIGPERVAVMERASGPKTGLLGRLNDSPGGSGFAAIHDGIAMVHALEILPHQRGQGLGGWFMRQAAFWAEENGAHTISALCTRANAGANALYASLGMSVVGQYHYRRAGAEPNKEPEDS